MLLSSAGEFQRVPLRSFTEPRQGYVASFVAEFFTAIGGLGYFILYQSRTFHHNEAFVGVLLLAAFGVGFEVLVNWSTRRFLPWYRRDERGE